MTRRGEGEGEERRGEGEEKERRETVGACLLFDAASGPVGA